MTFSDELYQAFRKFNPCLTEKDFSMIESCIQHRAYPAGHIILREGQICQNLYYMDRGAVRCFNPQNNRTYWGEFDQCFFLSVQSYIYQIPAQEALEVIEDSSVYSFPHKELQKLYQQNLNWANWGRNYAEFLMTYIEQLYKTMFYQSATERYENLLKIQPDILQRAPLKFIASYLGISQVSLSRIRADKQTRK